MVSDAGLTKFRSLYKQEYGIELSQKELMLKANRLLNLYKAVYMKATNIKISKNHDEKAQSKKNYR